MVPRSLNNKCQTLGFCAWILFPPSCSAGFLSEEFKNNESFIKEDLSLVSRCHQSALSSAFRALPDSFRARPSGEAPAFSFQSKMAMTHNSIANKLISLRARLGACLCIYPLGACILMFCCLYDSLPSPRRLQLTSLIAVIHHYKPG